MDKKTDRFLGMGVAMVTPFDHQGHVDVQALIKHTEYLISNGTDYLVVMGTTGESVTLSESEKTLVLRTVIDTNKGRLPVVLGAGSNNTGALVKALHAMDYKGVDAILSVAPYYNKPTQHGLFAHFTAVADASQVPVILYNVPGRTSSNLLPPTVLELAEHPNIVAIKEASGSFDQFMAIIREKPDDFLCISGDDGITLPFVAAGGDGVISVLGNAFPKAFGSMVELALAGKIAEARALHYQLLPIVPLLFEEGSPAGIKEVLQMLEICENHVRLPLVGVSDELKDALEEAFQLINAG